MTALLTALLGAIGVHLLYTSLVLGHHQLRPAPVSGADRDGWRRRWLTGVVPPDTPVHQLAAVITMSTVLAALAGFAVFGGVLPSVALAVFAGTFPIASQRARHRERRAAAMDAWPRMLEELRTQTSSLGRPIPQALFDVGRRAPAEMRAAFEAAQREWLLSTDFARSARVLKAGLADPTADAACETLVVAHEVGGTDLDRRLAALIEDRIQDTQGRKDARAEQAGARFARRFVLIVPAGMAMAGMSVGTGRAAYQTGTGQALVVVAIGLVVACWVWAGQIMTLPEEQRVFDV